MNIDNSYFTKGRRQILNATNNEVAMNPNNRAVNTAINGFIEQYSPAFLEMVVGEDMAKKVLENDGEDEMLKAIFENLKEPMADYVMFYIIRYTSQQSTINGVVEIKSGNRPVSPARLQADVWNEMVNGLKRFQNHYPEYRVDQCLLSKITYCWI